MEVVTDTLDIIIGAVSGIVVCAFGIWCFIHGQQNALQIKAGSAPQQLQNPVRAIAQTVVPAKQDSEITNQLKNMFAYDGFTPKEKVNK